MTATRHSMIWTRSSLVAGIVIASVLPYYAAHWLVRHDSVYYWLGGTGRFGRFITDTAEMINFVSPFPFLALGLVVGLILAFKLRCFRLTATVDS
jgi:hypothetical protein